MGMPILVGAGLGALTSAATGKSPFTGALLGGATGGLAGGTTSLLNGGSFIEGAMGNVAKTAATSGIPAVAEAGAAPFEGAVYNQSAGTWMNPEYYLGASTPMATYTGGEGVLSNAFGDLKSKIPDWATPQNMTGAMNLASQFQHKPIQGGGGGGIIHGSFQPKGSQLSTGDLLVRKQSNPFLLG